MKCPNSGAPYNHGRNDSGVVKYRPGRDPRKDLVVCRLCGKKLKPQTLLGEVQSYHTTALYSIVRYHHHATN